jgi:hypothetical protein
MFSDVPDPPNWGDKQKRRIGQRWHQWTKVASVRTIGHTAKMGS